MLTLATAGKREFVYQWLAMMIKNLEPQISKWTNSIEIKVNLESLWQINFRHRSPKSSHRYKENSPQAPKISKKNLPEFHIEILHSILQRSLCYFTII